MNKSHSFLELGWTVTNAKSVIIIRSMSILSELLCAQTTVHDNTQIPMKRGGIYQPSVNIGSTCTPVCLL